MSSATGLRPRAAAPAAAPMKALSLIGVSSTRSRPNSPERPLVTPNGPPHASSSPGAPAPPHMSSPITITVGSRRISSNKASLSACRNDFWLMESPLVGDVDVGQDRLWDRPRRRLGLRHRLVDKRIDLGIDGVELRGFE